MAEKYGTIPKRFTVEWWKYFWYYYKWHTIATAFVLFMIGSTIHSCVTAEKFDLNILHMGNISFGDDNSAAVELALEEFIEDIDQNEEKNISLVSMAYSGEQQNAEYDMAIQTKFYLSFQDDNSYVYLLDADMCADMAQNNTLQDFFLPLSEWGIDVEANIPTEKGGEYALSLEGSKILEENGCNSKNLCIMIKPLMQNKKIETEKLAQKNGFKVVQELLKK